MTGQIGIGLLWTTLRREGGWRQQNGMRQGNPQTTCDQTRQGSHESQGRLQFLRWQDTVEFGSGMRQGQSGNFANASRRHGQVSSSSCWSFPSHDWNIGRGDIQSMQLKGCHGPLKSKSTNLVTNMSNSTGQGAGSV